MPPSSPIHDPQTVLQHLAWVQRLAHRLCADAAQAEDVSQESLLAAFRGTPRRGSDIKQWLGGIVRNQARMARRGEGRRAGREAAAAHPEAQPSAADLVERVSTQRAVVDAVMGLEDLYRDALLRRYFDELGPKQIAALEGVPEATIKTRLSRGLALLRARLASELGDEGDGTRLFRALAPLAGMELRRQLGVASTLAPIHDATTAPVTLGAPKLVAGLALTLAVGGALWSLAGTGVEPSVDAPARPVSALAEADTRAPRTASEPRGLGRRALGPGQASAASTDRIGGPQLRVRARALDLAGQAVRGLELGFERSAEVLGATDEAGALTFEREPVLDRVVSRSPAWVTLIPGTVFPYGPEAEVNLIVARPRRVRGTITDGRGLPIAGALVRYGTELDLRMHFDVPLDRAARVEWFSTSDASGQVEFASVPELPEAGLWVEARGFESATLAIESSGNAMATCALEPLAPSSTWIEGLVRLPDGRPAAGAAVSLGTYAVSADTEGRFRIDANDREQATELWVALAGFEAVGATRPAEGWPGELELQLERPPASIAGRVVDSAGNPVRGIEVDLADPTPFGFLPTEGHSTYLDTTLEALSAGERAGVRTDAAGRFELSGLLDRSYALVLRDPNLPRLELVGPFHAGARQLELVLPDPGELVRIAGRVVDDLGQPLPGARVALVRSDGEHSVAGPSATVDAAGHFRFLRDLPADTELRVFAGGGYSTVQAPLEVFEQPDRIELVLLRTGSFFIRLEARPDCADRFSLEARDGQPVWLQQVDGRGAFTMQYGSFERGRSPVIRAALGTHWLVLWRGEQEVERILLDLTAGPPTCINL